MANPANGAPAHETTAGRDEHGRFTKGNPGGPGNPFARQVAALRKLFIDTVGNDGLRHICQRLVAQALLGDVPSAKVVLSYVLGKTPEPVNPDTLDQEECKQYLENPTCEDVQEVHQRRPPANMSMALMRGVHLAQEEQARQVFCQEAEAPAKEEAAPATEETKRTPAAEAPRPRHASEAPSTNGPNGATPPNSATAPFARRLDRPAGPRLAPSRNGDNGQRRAGGDLEAPESESVP